jgi:hypothetical protein
MTAAISLCRGEDVDAVQAFLDAHWSPGHALARSRPLFDWQYRQADGSYSMLAARRPGDGDILGVLGFIPSTRFDAGAVGRESVWLALWKVRPDAGAAGLGVALLSRLSRLAPWTAIGAVGLAAESRAILAALGYQTGVMARYCLLNHDYLAQPERRPFRLAAFGPGGPAAMNRSSGDEGVRLVRLNADDFAAAAGGLANRIDAAPARTTAYHRQRFFDHPFYRYDVYAVRRGEITTGLLALRLAAAEGARALRLVDYFGPVDGLAGGGPAFQTLLRDADAEYIDVFNAGLPPETFTAAGFTPLAPAADDMIIPGLFEPFVRSNPVLHYAMKIPSGAPFVLFKADGDQDRPNHISPP